MTVAGLLHVRRMPAVAAVVIVACAAVVTFYDLSIEVQAVIDTPPRGVGAPELIGALLALCLPIVTAPSFDGRERLGAPIPRLTHTLISMAVLATPLLLLPVWRAAVNIRQPAADMPPVSLLVGNLVMVSTLATVLVLVAGRPIGTVLTIVSCAGFVTAQQAWPQGPWATHFSTAYHWHTDWLLTSLLLAGTALIVHHTTSVPRDLT